MFPFVRTAITAALLLIAAMFSPARAQTAKTNADPALWVVKDKDTTIYLFGTFHMLKPGLDWFDDGVKKAFDASGELVTEVIAPEGGSLGELMASLAVDHDGPPLSTRLSAETRKNYEAVMAELKIPPAAFDTFKPWAAALFIQVTLFQQMGYGPASGAEAVLSAAAKTAGKPLGELETADSQLRLLDSMPERVQIAFLEGTVKSLPETRAMLDRMLADWSKGDADGLATLMNDSLDETPELHKLMLADRNAKWADWIAARLKRPGTVFVAVGAGHLAGKDSVQDYLAAHKLKAKRVRY